MESTQGLMKTHGEASGKNRGAVLGGRHSTFYFPLSLSSTALDHDPLKKGWRQMVGSTALRERALDLTVLLTCIPACDDKRRTVPLEVSKSAGQELL